MPTFRTELLRGSGTTMGIVVPPEVVAQLGKGKRPPVTVTINGYTYRNTIAVMGGQYMVGVANEHRKPAGVENGGLVDVTIELDSTPREVEVPEDFAAALAAEPGLRKRFDTLAFTHRKEHVRAILDAKSAETRARRIAKAVEMVRGKAG
jgi:hypothetical protein